MKLTVSADQHAQKLDRFVAHGAGVSRRIARLWIASGRVVMNRQVVRILTRPISAGATVIISLADAPSQRELAPQQASIPILHLDRWCVVVNKPAKLLSEHDRYNSPSLESILPAVMQQRGEQPRLWLVHRLDAGTSGVMILARTPSAARALCTSFRERTAKKTYVALCSGTLPQATRVDAPIQRIAGTRHGVRSTGKPAQTSALPLAQGDSATLLQAVAHTGRTHQIRVHLAHLGHPLLGDRLYSGPGFTAATPAQSIGRPMLHAQQLAIAHPKSGAPMVCRVAPPEDFQEIAAAFSIEYRWREMYEELK